MARSIGAGILLSCGIVWVAAVWLSVLASYFWSVVSAGSIVAAIVAATDTTNALNPVTGILLMLAQAPGLLAIAGAHAVRGDSAK